MTNITDMTADALNGALAEALGVDLRARPDGSDDYQIACLWLREQADTSIVRLAFRTYENYHPVANLNMQAFVWKERNGYPWQESIEEFHAAWCRGAPDYCGDEATSRQLGYSMREHGVTHEYIEALKAAVTANDGPLSEFDLLLAIVEVTPRTNSEAALAALRGRV